MIWNEAKDYLFIALGLFIYTIAFTVFLMPYQIVAGGVTGLSAIIYYATGFHLENTYIIINGLLLVVALKILGVKFLMKTIFAIFTLYFMLMFAQEIIPKQENGLPIKLMGEGQDFMSMIIGCVLTGIALATVFLNNGSTGGTDIIAVAGQCSYCSRFLHHRFVYVLSAIRQLSGACSQGYVRLLRHGYGELRT